RVDPALMESAGGNRFRTRVYPIPANGRKRVFFVYDQAPVELGARTAVALPVPKKLPRGFRLELLVDARCHSDAVLVASSGETPLASSDAASRRFLRADLVPRGE